MLYIFILSFIVQYKTHSEKLKFDSKDTAVVVFRTHQALPRDSVIEDLRFQNRYLQEKLHTLEKQSSKDASSKPSVSVYLFFSFF